MRLQEAVRGPSQPLQTLPVACPETETRPDASRSHGTLSSFTPGGYFPDEMTASSLSSCPPPLCAVRSSEEDDPHFSAVREHVSWCGWRPGLQPAGLPTHHLPSPRLVTALRPWACVSSASVLLPRPPAQGRGLARSSACLVPDAPGPGWPWTAVPSHTALWLGDCWVDRVPCIHALGLQ